MKTHSYKSEENKSRAVANEETQTKSGGTSSFQFVDNRPEAIAQRKMQAMVNNSPRTMQMKANKEMVHSSLMLKEEQSKENITPFQLVEDSTADVPPLSGVAPNNTGLPDNLKTGMETLSGMSLDDVRVHRNSNKPAQLQAHAYAQGTDIHLGPGQEKHLPHEAWHVVQQKQGRVKPTMQMKGKVNVNDDAGLEKEADVMGDKAMNYKASGNNKNLVHRKAKSVAQRKVLIKRKEVKPEDVENGYEYYEKTGKTSRWWHGSGDRNVSTMMADTDKNCYFESKKEMSDYARKKTDNIGYVEKENAWIRLPENGFIVFGEDHTQTTIMDLVAATGNRKFMYEAFTEAPEEPSKELETALDTRTKDIREKGSMGKKKKNEPSQQGEAFLPKVLRGLTDKDILPRTQLNAEGAVAMLLKWAFIYSKTAPSDSDLANYYATNKNVIDQTIKDLDNSVKPANIEMSKQMTSAGNTDLYVNFVEAFTTLTNQYVQSLRDSASPEDVQNFDNRWQLASIDYKKSAETPIMRAEKARDFSMYQHIKDAKNSNYAMYGLGNLHRLRLEPLLNHEGINHQGMRDYINAQKAKYPQ
jgi:hypothetical protein